MVIGAELEQKNWSEIDATFHGIVADRCNNNAMKLPL